MRGVGDVDHEERVTAAARAEVGDLAIGVEPDLFGREARAREAAHQLQRPAHVARRERDHRVGGPIAERCGDRVLAGFVADERAVAFDHPLTGIEAPDGREPVDRLAGGILCHGLETDHITGAGIDHVGRDVERAHGRCEDLHGVCLLYRTNARRDRRATGRDSGDETGLSDAHDGGVRRLPAHAVIAKIVET